MAIKTFYILELIFMGFLLATRNIINIYLCLSSNLSSLTMITTCVSGLEFLLKCFLYFDLDFPVYYLGEITLYPCVTDSWADLYQTWSNYQRLREMVGHVLFRSLQSKSHPLRICIMFTMWKTASSMSSSRLWYLTSSHRCSSNKPSKTKSSFLVHRKVSISVALW